MSEKCFFPQYKSAIFPLYQKQNPTYDYDGKVLKIKAFLWISISGKQQNSGKSRTIGKCVFQRKAPKIPLLGSEQRSPACQKRYENDSMKRMTSPLWNAGAMGNNSGFDFGVI